MEDGTAAAWDVGQDASKQRNKEGIASVAGLKLIIANTSYISPPKNITKANML